jgi:hypothetical protein
MQADSAYVSAVIDALATPGVIVGEQTIATVQNLIDAPVEIQTQSDVIGKVKIKPTDIPELLQNPSKFIDKLFEKNRKISKMSRLTTFGGQARMLAGSTYAKNADLFDGYDPKMRDILERGVGQVAMQGREGDTAWMIHASNKLVEDGVLGEKLAELRREYSRATSGSRKEFLKKQIDDIEMAYKKATKTPQTMQQQKEWGFDPRVGFTSLLNAEFEARKANVLGGRDKEELSPNEQREYDKMQRAQGLLSLWGQYENLPTRKKEFDDKIKELKEKRSDLLEQQRKIKEGLISFGSQAEKNRALNSIKRGIKDINSSNQALTEMRFWSNLGKLEGAYYGLSSTFGAGSLGAFITGDFLDPNKGFWGCPSVKAKLEIWQSKDDKIGKKGREVEFFKAVRLVKTDPSDPKQKGIKERHIRDAYNRGMVNLYYMLPTTWIRSLATGEAFAWRANKNLEKLTSFQFWRKGRGHEDLGLLRTPEFWRFYNEFRKASTKEQRSALLAGQDEYRRFIEKILPNLMKIDSDFAKKFRNAEKLLKSIERWSNAAWIFSTPQRIKKFVVDETFGKVQQAFRNGVYKILSSLEMFTKDKAAMAMLEAWKKTGGKALSGAISKALVGLLGFTGTAAAGPVGAVATFVTARFLDWVLKITLKVTVYTIIGFFIAMFGLLLLNGGAITEALSSYNEYTYEIPGEVYKNPNFTSYGGGMGINPIDDEGAGYENDGQLPEFVSGNLPASETCLFVAGSNLRCTQGPFSYCSKPGYLQPSHKNSPAIDVAIGGNFAAPQFCSIAEGNCVVDAVGQTTCGGGAYPAGGFVQFSATYEGRTYQFYVLHVAIGVSAGQKLSSGQAVATIVHDESWSMCSTGLHAHVKVTVNGKTYNPRDVLNGDFGCSIGTCPVQDVCYIME